MKTGSPIAAYAERFVHPDEQHWMAEEVRISALTADPNYRGYAEHRIVRPDGEVRYIAWSGPPSQYVLECLALADPTPPAETETLF